MKSVCVCREKVSLELTATQSRVHQLAQKKPLLVADSEHLVAQAVEQVKATSAIAVRDILTPLPAMVDSYQCHFDPNDLGPYRVGLYSYFDQQLSAELEKMASSSLTEVYDATQGGLIGKYGIPREMVMLVSVALFHTEKYQPLLQLSSSDLSQLKQMIPTLHISYLLHCADLCEDFSEDLQFHFSLGLNTVLVHTLSCSIPCPHLLDL